MRDALNAQRDLSIEIERETARIIRTRGVPLFEAVEMAKQQIRRQRTAQSNNRLFFETLSNLTKEKSQ